jgi:hypothetical protein
MSVSLSHREARLANHVRACRVGDQMIFLDLLRDKYIGMGGPQIAALSEAILGQGAADGVQAEPSDTEHLDKYILRLRQQHLLSNEPAIGPMRTSPPLDTPSASLILDDQDCSVTSEWRQLLRLWRSTFVAGAWLCRLSLADISERIFALRHPYRRHQASTDALRASVESYIRLRPFALSTHDRCLHDSLTLIHFLSAEGLLARWVIGVRVDPFGAHAWAQAGDTVLNDYPERVRRFKPILVV